MLLEDFLNNMSQLYQNKYRIPSSRLQHWDYRSDGAYFITSCTQNRRHYFGEIENNEMQLNTIGKLAHQYWEEIPQHFPHIELGNFIIMPNHVHGILIVNHPISASAFSRSYYPRWKII